MKILFPIFILLLLSIGCQNTQHKPVAKSITVQNDSNTSKLTIPNPEKHDSVHAKQDTITIMAGSIYEVKFSRTQYNTIIDSFPNLHSDNPSPPDIAYAETRHTINGDDIISFDSECGKDVYYIVYAYFLEMKEDSIKYTGRRDTLIKIYDDINAIYSTLKESGTYFAHQCGRIRGYAAYSIYTYAHYKDDFDKPYSVEEQKKLYIASLKQMINDEVSHNNDLLPEEHKKKVIVYLSKSTKDLNVLITDNLYLEEAREFQYSHY